MTVGEAAFGDDAPGAAVSAAAGRRRSEANKAMARREEAIFFMADVFLIFGGASRGS
jgi:hypothetical protein